MQKSSFIFVLKSFLVWRVFLLVVTFLAVQLIKLQPDFLGGGLLNYRSNPFLWSWANFDGEHYLSLAQNGYSPLTYFFFPVYPILIRILSIGSKDLFTLLVSGLTISNLSLILGVVGLIRLVNLDYEKSISYLTVIIFLVFPTSFYLGSVYTESLFFALLVWSFYFARKGKWLISAVLGIILTATRIVGLALIPALIVEMLQQKKWKLSELNIFDYFIVLLPLLGLLLYILYLNKVTGDPLDFIHNVTIYGQQRSSGLILLPQVFYRYIFKILPQINYNYFPVVFTSWLEFLTAIIFGLLVIFPLISCLSDIKNRSKYGILEAFKIKESYLVFSIIAYIIPTLSGSFSSLPRYVMVIFPTFILIANFLSCQKILVKAIYFSLSILGLIISCSMFVRGYWVA